MNYPKMRSIKKLYFGYEDIAKALGVSLSSARVAATRLCAQGILVRVKRNIYLLRESWDGLSGEDAFALANLIQSPSYVSLMTALDHYGVTTQAQRGFVESVALRRTKEVDVRGSIFNYTKIDAKLYFGFNKKGVFFIAEPEKAFLDACYLASLKRYAFDMTSIDRVKLDRGRIERMAKIFPKRTKEFLVRYGYLKKA